MGNDIYRFSIQMLTGQSLHFSSLQGKVLLLVNTASQCGFTPQYEGLQELYESFQNQGLMVIGFPCNQFGSQEPGSNQSIGEFCELNYGVSFPVSQKVDVNGANAHPLFAHLTSHAKGVFSTECVKWNFTKFLVDREGNVISRFAPTTKPEDLVEPIQRLIAA